MNKQGMGFIWIVLVLMFALVGYAVSMNANFDVESFKNNLNWTPVDIQVTEQPELASALSYFVNGLGQALFEFAKWVASFAAENPHISYKLLIYLVILSLLAPIAVALFQLVVIIVILIKEFIQSRKEKRLLKNELKRGKTSSSKIRRVS